MMLRFALQNDYRLLGHDAAKSGKSSDDVFVTMTMNIHITIKTEGYKRDE
jgi:hypothetical protein